MSTQQWKVGTRGSQLATTQAGHVRDALIAGGHPAALEIVTTHGDVNMSPVERIGVGVFTQALRDVLARGDVDIAVHSYKDLPTAPDDRFHLVVPRREDFREALVARDGLTLAELPDAARVGTSAPRRVSQLRALRPDLDIRPLRGNIDSRMGRVDSGELDAVILAAAGISRLGQLDRVTELLEPSQVMPAPAQGALAVECRAVDAEMVQALNALADPVATAAVNAERTLLATLEAGCTAPVAAHADFVDGELRLVAGVFALDGSRQLRVELTGVDPFELGRQAAHELLERGAGALMR